MSTAVQSSAATAAEALLRTGHRLSWPCLALIALAHAGAVAWLVTRAAPPAPPPSTILMVRSIAPASAPAAPTPAKVQREVRPTPVTPLALPPPVLAAQTTNTSSAAPASVAAAAETAAPAPSAPATLTPARFDAAYLNNPPPSYPPLSRRLGEQGKVVLHVFVEADGHPARIEIRTSSASPRLDQAAVDAVGRWRFVAAREGNETVGAWVLVPVVFTLKG
jgi:protein TonB